MSVALHLGGLILLFVLLGSAADLAITNVRLLGQRLRITPFSLGLLLGVLTSLPELFVGINATLRDVAQVSFGNLMGGVVVLFGLIAGLLMIADDHVPTTHLFQRKWLLIIAGFIVLPMFLAMDGVVSLMDGLFLVLIYLLIINGLLSSPSEEGHVAAEAELQQTEVNTKKAVAAALAGFIGLLIVSHFIIEVTLRLAELLALPLFFTGLVVFSIGTNLPEISVAFTAWRKKVERLGLGNIMGSAFTNALVVGVLAVLNPIALRTSLSFWIFFLILLMVVGLFVFFGISGGKFTRREGIVLLALYVLFLLSELGCVTFASQAICLR